MRSVTRTAAVTAGLGAALIGGAGSAVAGPVDALGGDNPVKHLSMTATQEGALSKPFPVSASTDRLPVEKLTQDVRGTVHETVPQTRALPQLPTSADQLSAVQAVPGVPKLA